MPTGVATSSTSSFGKFKVAKSRKKRRKAPTITTSRRKKFDPEPAALPWERRTPEDVEVLIDDIFIPACQRETQPNAKGIQDNFTESLLERLTVNTRKPSEGINPKDNPNAWAWESTQPRNATLALTDGYQRLTALKALGFTHVKVRKFKASAAWENWYFQHQKVLEAAITRKDLHISHVATDQPQAVLLDTILKRNGFYAKSKLSAKGNSDIPLSSVTGVEDVLQSDRSGEGIVLDRTLSIIRNCWSSYPKAGHHDVVRGIGLLVQGYGTKLTPAVEDKWRKTIQVGALLEEANGAGSQIARAYKIATKLRSTAKITKKPHLNY